MKDSDGIKLGTVQETLLLPLWGRAVETQKNKPLLTDNKAVSIIKKLPYDFTVIAKNISSISQAAWTARSIYFDSRIKDFISLYPEATIVNVGCGLDTTFDRVDNGSINWIDLDLPDTIELRRKYIEESERRRFVARSVFDRSWYDTFENKSHVMLMIAGVLYYFDEAEVKKLFGDFYRFLPGTEVVFDYASPRGVSLANKQVIDKGGMDKSAYMKWGTDDIRDIEKWDGHIKVLDSMLMFEEHRKKYPLLKRIGMKVSDTLRIMSLAHVRIN